jgi:hypothetical protein
MQDFGREKEGAVPAQWADISTRRTDSQYVALNGLIWEDLQGWCNQFLHEGENTAAKKSSSPEELLH